ncbi:MAG: PD40 domain-containing protein [Spirochaetes bacterium]|nr:PD40 domain-containing protein [Spirochaetota bacterium]
MDQKKIKIKIKIKIKSVILLFIFFLSFPLFASAEEEDDNDIFNYKKLIYNEFALKTGSVIPLTIWQAIETDGNLTQDGRYLFFASNREKGNFDIYLRSMYNITTVKLTEHSSKDYNPAVSPDGKYLAFVSRRDDPEGDIFIMKIDPEDIIEKTEKSVTGISSPDLTAQNLTIYQDTESGVIRIIKDASPCWSPDGESIAFSSVRDGIENIWLMNRKGDDLVQLTTKGGSYPHFSNDGRKIVYVSYRDKDSNGDIYILDIARSKETRITNTAAIELNPVFLKNSDEIAYTLIDKDTNNDNKIDLRDNSVLYYKNLTNNVEYQLTQKSESSFSPFWSPAYDGIILYSNQTGENININLIPDYGIIPKKNNAENQLGLSERLMTETDDTEKYLLNLERVYYFFNKAGDVNSRIFISKGLTQAAAAYMIDGDAQNTKRILNVLSGLSKNEMDYSSIMSRYIESIMNGRPGDITLSEAVSELSKNTGNKLVPFLLEDLGDEYRRLYRIDDALKIYARIMQEHSDFKRIIYVHLKSAETGYTSLADDMSDSYLQVLSSGFIYLRLKAAKDIISVFDREKDNDRKIRIAEAMYKKYGDIKNTSDLFLYIAASAYFKKGNLEKARTALLKALEFSRSSSYTFYKINVLLGNIFEREKKYAEMEKYLSAGAQQYIPWYKEQDYISIINRLIDYYEVYGERAESAGKYSESVELYRGYVSLVKYLHTRKMYPEFYNEYASRAHILYINAFSKLKANDYSELRKLEYEYNKKQNNLKQARIAFDRAHIYGLAYIYAGMAANIMQQLSSSQSLIDENALFEQLIINSRNSVDQIEWALFMDDTFVDAELLKGWVYQYIDLKREESEKAGKNYTGLINKYFPQSLWETNISNYEKALEINDESLYPEREGNLNLNIANTYFLLKNYPRAFTHYMNVVKYKKSFSSRRQEALFYYHLGYCYWQNDNIGRAREEMQKTLFIYNSLSSGNYKRYRYQFYNLYRFFALFERTEKKYNKAVTWYKRIIDFSKRYKLDIDRARFLQEIAFCYKELGNNESALVYLNRAERQLKDYDTKEKDYSLTFKLFGLFEFGLLDLGQDTYVIGDNRIVDELDTVQKKMLNASLEYEIYYNNGEYTKAVKSLEKKLAVIGKRESRVYAEARVIALNNIGYCYFKLMDYEKADSYFKKAWNSASKNSDDLEGLFITIQNSAGLFSFLLENKPEILTEPEKKIDTFLKQINDYRDQYEQKRLEKEMKSLREKAKAEKREVNESELTALKEAIAAEAEKKYYSLDIVTGVFEFQKAEILKRGLETGNENNAEPDSGYDYYKDNKDIFQLYRSASARFESAVKIAENNQSKRLLVKLLLNLAGCQSGIGLPDDSYNTYLGAVKIASKYEYHDLLWYSYYSIAELLNKHAGKMEGVSRSMALGYYENAVKIIEEYPYLYSGEMNRVVRLYNSYMQMLASFEKPQRAISVSEHGYEVQRLMLLALNSPEFYSPEDNADYSTYIKQIKEIEKNKVEISAILETDAPETALSKKEQLKARTLSLNAFINNLKKKKPFFASFLSLSGDTLPKYNDSVIYQFISSDAGINAWKIDSGKVTFRKIPFNKEKDLIIEKIAAFMKDGYTDKNRFVVFNETAVNIFLKGLSAENSPEFIYIPSIARAKYYASPNNIIIDNIIFNGKGLAENVSEIKDDSDLQVAEESLKTADISEYSVLIDAANELSYTDFFSKRLEPALLIKKVKNINQESLLLLNESLLYSGGRTAFYYNDDRSPENIADLLKRVNNQTFQRAASQTDGITGFGFRGYTHEERKQKISQFINIYFKKYRMYLDRGNYELAELYLKRWYKQNTDEKNNPIYLYNISEIEFLKGDIKKSISYLNTIINQTSGRKEIYNKALSAKIFLLLYSSDIAAASETLRMAGQVSIFKTSMDYFIYNAIAELVADNKISSKEITEKIRFLKSILPEDKLILLFSEYLHLSDKHDLTTDLLKEWKNAYNTTDRDLLKYALLSGKISEQKFFSQRAENIAAIGKNEDIENLVISLSLVNGKYDHMSVFPVYFAINSMIKTMRSDSALNILQEVNPDQILKISLPADSLQLLKQIIYLYENEQQYENALKYTKEMNALLNKANIQFLLKEFMYKEAVYLSKLEKHEESYNSALAGLALSVNDNELYNKYQLILIEEALYLGKADDADERIKKLESVIKKNKNEYVLFFLKARMELLNVLKAGKAGDSQWVKIEKMIQSGLASLDSSPDIISAFDRIDLINEGLEFLISYKMSRNNNLDSLLYAEVKKQINLRSKYTGLAARYKLPEDVLNRFKTIKSKKRSMEFVKLLIEYPSLQIKALAGYLPLELFRKKLKEDSIVFYAVKNINDILCCVITRDSVKNIRLKEGYLKAEKILNMYNNDLTVKNITRVSQKLYELFKPLEIHYVKKNDIIFITDNELEKIPFEIIGSGTILDEVYNVTYIPSILSSFKPGTPVENSVSFADTENRSLINKLELVSVKESGIQYNYRMDGNGVAHINSEILFDSFKGELYIKGKIYGDMVRGDFLYVPDFNLRNVSLNDFILLNYFNGINGAVINNASIHDLNNAEFVSKFYRKLQFTSEIRASFQSAKESLRVNRNFVSPAYWSGIRLYHTAL